MYVCAYIHTLVFKKYFIFLCEIDFICMCVDIYVCLHNSGEIKKIFVSFAHTYISTKVCTYICMNFYKCTHTYIQRLGKLNFYL